MIFIHVNLQKCCVLVIPEDARARLIWVRPGNVPASSQLPRLVVVRAAQLSGVNRLLLAN